MTLRRADPHTHPLQWSSSRAVVRGTRHPPEQPRRVQRGDDTHLLNGDEQPCKVRNQSAALNTSVQFVTTFDNEVRLVLRGHPELSSFSQEYTGGRGSMATVHLFKMLIMMHCVFIRGRYNSSFSQFNRGSQKKYCVTLCVRF